MKNKKGFLLGEYTLKVVIAIICILLLVFLLFTLYNTFSGKSNDEQARANLKKLEEGIKVVLSGNQEFFFIFTEPKGWIFMIFSKEEGPNSCLSQQCVCICEKASWLSSQKKKCFSKDICLPVPKNFEMPSSIKIDGPTGILIKSEGGKIIFRKK